jgi:hypothetical protein
VVQAAQPGADGALPATTLVKRPRLHFLNLPRDSFQRPEKASARTKVQLVKATAKHLRSVQRQPDRIQKYFEHGPLRYAA